MGFHRQEYWSGLPFPPPRDLPNPATEPTSPALAGGVLTTEPPGKLKYFLICLNMTTLDYFLFKEIPYKNFKK